MQTHLDPAAMNAPALTSSRLPTRQLLGEMAAMSFAVGLAGFGVAKTLRSVGLVRRDSSVARNFLTASAAVAAVLAVMPTRRFSYDKRSVVITGGSRGLGFALAQQLLEEGARVTLLSRDPDELARACLALSKISPRVFTVVCDVTDTDQVEQALAEARARWGRIDVLINNAGTVTVAPLNSLENKEFDAQYDVHLKAPVITTRCVQPYFRQVGGGQIINISSIGGKIPVAHMGAYCASKFALGGFSETAAIELADENIVVTTVYPGLMRTGSPAQAVFKGDHASEYAWFAAADSTPGLSMAADDAARAILNGARTGKSQVIVSIPAKLGNLAHTLLPETFSTIMKFTARLLPETQSHERMTGAESRKSLGNSRRSRFLRWLTAEEEERFNQVPREDAEYNLGMH